MGGMQPSLLLVSDPLLCPAHLLSKTSERQTLSGPLALKCTLGVVDHVSSLDPQLFHQRKLNQGQPRVHWHVLCLENTKEGIRGLGEEEVLDCISAYFSAVSAHFATGSAGPICLAISYQGNKSNSIQRFKSQAVSIYQASSSLEMG